MQDVPTECALCRAEVEAYRRGTTGIVIVDKEPDALGDYALLGGDLLRLIPDGEPSQSAGTMHESKAARLLLRRFSAHRSTCKALPKVAPPELTKTRPLPKGVRRGG